MITEYLLSKTGEKAGMGALSALWAKAQNLRARAFFDQFVLAAGLGANPTKLEEWLNELASDSGKIQVLAEAERSVRMSKSRSLGPRVIAMIAARLIFDGRLATEEEERVLAAAESVGDRDLLAFRESFTSDGRRSDSTFWMSTLGGTFSWWILGTWAAALAKCGLLSERGSSLVIIPDKEIGQHVRSCTFRYETGCELLCKTLEHILTGAPDLIGDIPPPENRTEREYALFHEAEGAREGLPSKTERALTLLHFKADRNRRTSKGAD